MQPVTDNLDLQYSWGWLRRLVWGYWYEYVARLAADSPYDFLNFGYAPVSDGNSLKLSAADESNRPFIELYYRTAAARDLRGARVLEVSCGRGGGASFVSRYLEPELLLAVDRSPSLIAYCKSRHHARGLFFAEADAEQLDLPESDFDALINIEASHAYGSRERFLSCACRVIKPGGSLLTADFCPADDLADWKRAIEGVGFEVREQEDITKGVLQSLRKTHRIRMQAIRDLTPGWLFPLFRNFTGAQGSRIVRAMKRGQVVYMRFAAVKTSVS